MATEGNHRIHLWTRRLLFWTVLVLGVTGAIGSIGMWFFATPAKSQHEIVLSWADDPTACRRNVCRDQDPQGNCHWWQTIPCEEE